MPRWEGKPCQCWEGEGPHLSLPFPGKRAAGSPINTLAQWPCGSLAPGCLPPNHRARWGGWWVLGGAGEGPKGMWRELGALLCKCLGEGTLQAWADEVLDEHQLSAVAGTTWSPGSLPAQGLWNGFSECLQKVDALENLKRNKTLRWRGWQRLVP